MRTIATSAFLVALLAVSCGAQYGTGPYVANGRQQPATVVTNRDVMATVPDPFKPLFDFHIPTDKVDAFWAALPYDRITMERTACFGTCPVYEVSFFGGGKAELHAVRWPQRKMDGRYSGTIHIFDYGKLCYLMKEMGFDTLAPRYAGSWTDSAAVIVKASSPQGTKAVVDYAGVGPIRLWAVQQAIDALVADVVWK